MRQTVRGHRQFLPDKEGTQQKVPEFAGDKYGHERCVAAVSLVAL